MEDVNQTLIEYRSNAKNEIKAVKMEMKQMKEQDDLIKRISDIDPDSKIVGTETNKNGEKLIVTEWLSPRNLWIKLYGQSYKGINNLPRIMSTINKNAYTHDNFIHINDIIMVNDDIGNGSIAMKYFIKAAEQLEVDYISGSLSPEDQDHFDRSQHYYEKFGFDVEFNAKRTSGSMKKVMK